MQGFSPRRKRNTMSSARASVPCPARAEGSSQHASSFVSPQLVFIQDGTLRCGRPRSDRGCSSHRKRSRSKSCARSRSVPRGTHEMLRTRPARCAPPLTRHGEVRNSSQHIQPGPSPTHSARTKRFAELRWPRQGWTVPSSPVSLTGAGSVPSHLYRVHEALGEGGQARGDRAGLGGPTTSRCTDPRSSR